MVAAFRDLRQRRLPIRDCAERIGVAYVTAFAKAKELGINHRLNAKQQVGRRANAP
jgi:hypothetical protein